MSVSGGVMLNGSGVEQAVAVPSRIQAAVKKQAEAAANLREVRRQLAQERTKLAALERRLAALRAAALPRRREVWCADLTETGTGAVATIEVPGEPQRMLIAPGCPPPQKSDGQVLEREILDPNQAYFNAAVLPGVQKWRPDYRLGTLSAVDYSADKATVLLDAAQSSADSLPINQAGVLESIPVVYQSCHAAAFSVGDRVVVAFLDRKWAQAYVCGFESHPKACTKPWLLLWADAPAAWDNPIYPRMLSGLSYGKPFDEQGVGTARELNPVNSVTGRSDFDYEGVRFCAVGLDAQGGWHGWPWLNSVFALKGAGLRPGNWTQRVYLKGRKRLLQFAGATVAGQTASFGSSSALWQLLGSEFDGRPVITSGARDHAIGPDARTFFPDCTEAQLKGVGNFRDVWDNEWLISVMYLRASSAGLPLHWNDYSWHGWAVFARGSGGSWQLIGQDVYTQGASGWAAWAWAADQQWRFRADGAQAALVANNAVRRIHLGSAARGVRPMAAFDWDPVYQEHAGLVWNESAPVDTTPPGWMLVPGSADYDAKSGALRVSRGESALPDAFLSFPVWVDNRFGVELWWRPGGYEFRRPGKDPLSWPAAVGSLAFAQFDGAAGIAGFYTASRTWKVLRFNAAGTVVRDDWLAAPAVYRGMAHGFPMVVGTTEEVWR